MNIGIGITGGRVSPSGLASALRTDLGRRGREATVGLGTTG